MLLRSALVVAFTAFALPALAASPAARAALAVTDGVIVPHYRALAAAADANTRAWDMFCNGRPRPNEATLRAGYHALADRWAEVEFVRTGPIVLFLRHERFSYWPELRNATQRNLDGLLVSRDPKALMPETLAHDSIPSQGLPAIERLLYEPAYQRHPRRCAVGLAIARNLSRIAHDLANGWSSPSGLRASIAANRSWNGGLIANAGEAARALLTDLVSGLTAMNDQKLLAPMGASAAQAKPRLAEAWRSGRSMRNLLLNIAGLREMARTFAAKIPPAVRMRIQRAFDAAVAAIRALPADIGTAAAQPIERNRLTAARAALKVAQVAVVSVLAPALGITLGFNALDGD